MSVRTVTGRGALVPADGPILVSIGVFDGLHLGHAWLLEHLVREARLRSVRSGVITFDAHPDAVLLGSAPPLLMDPDERLERLAGLGVDVVVIEHFDDALRQTAYDEFVAGIARACRLAGFVMTPDAAFGHGRAGTPAALAELGRREGFEVSLVPPFTLDGREVRSSDIRSAIGAGRLEAAEQLLGRPYAITGRLEGDGRLVPPMPVACPPPGSYRVSLSVPTGGAAPDSRSDASTTVATGVLEVTDAGPARLVEPIPVAAGSIVRLEFARGAADA